MTVFPTLVAGGTSVFMPRFTPEGFMATVEREAGTHSFMVPTQFRMILNSPEFGKYDLSSMKLNISAGAAMPLPLKKQVLKEMGNGLLELYGLTEGNFGTTLKPEDILDKTGSVGTPISGVDLRILDEEGTELPFGQMGEITDRGWGMMKYYHNRPDATDELIWKDDLGRTFIRTGDMGKFDEDGFLYILDRKRDMIISGGVNVFASDLEAVLIQHPDVFDVSIIAIPNEKWGETPLALVILKDKSAFTEEEMKVWANSKLAKHQRIYDVVFRKEDFPRNALGKVLKLELRKPYWQNENG